jgi:hypothetical protein
MIVSHSYLGFEPEHLIAKPFSLAALAAKVRDVLDAW